LQLVTDALNDDASLLSLQIQGNKVNITGQAQNASLLMKQLDATPGFRDVRAPAPATKPLGAVRESFTIEFNIDPEQLPKPAIDPAVVPTVPPESPQKKP
jgi:general secretion pathway protein L